MISVIVVSYNSGKYLGECLASLIKLPDTEVLLVDNSSSDNSLAVAAQYPSIRVFPQKKNLGFNAGNQIGIDNAKGDIVVFINPDTRVPANFSSKILEAFRAHPEIGVL